MPGSPFFGDVDTDALANSGTPEDLLRKKFPGMFATVPANGNANPFASLSAPTVPPAAPSPDVQAPDLGTPSLGNPHNLPFLPGYQPPQPQRPPIATPTGQWAPGTNKAQKLELMLRNGLMGAMAGRAASEQAVIQSGGRRSGGLGIGFEAGFEQPLIQASQQQQFERGAIQNQQGQQQVQLTQQQLNQAKALNAAYAAGTTKDPQTGAVTFDRNKVTQALARSGQGALIPGLTQSFTAMDDAQGKVTEQKDKHAAAADDYIGAGLQAIVKSKNAQTGAYDPATAGAVLAHIAQVYPQEAEQLRQQIAANPANLNRIVDGAIAQSPSQQKLSNEAWKTVDGRLVNTATGATMGEQLPIDQLNAGLAQRYQVLNPGKPLPASFTLQPNATQKDFDRVDKLMQQTEQGQGTKALRDQSAAIRNQTLSMAQQNQQDREEKQGIQWVSWEDSSGRTVAGPLSMARQAGAKNPAQVPTEEIRNITDARQVVNMINKQGDSSDPSMWGVRQLANSLQKDGKMGAFTSRYNRLLAQGIGSEPDDDPRIITLLDKSQLMTTLLMKAHFGAGGGRSPQMLAHFESLANAGKMDAPTFLAGTKAIGDYASDRAMSPGGSGAQKYARPKANVVVEQ